MKALEKKIKITPSSKYRRMAYEHKKATI